MIKHILVVKNDGGSLYSKCFVGACHLDNVSSPEAHQLYKTLKTISTEKPSSKVKTIIFEEMKLLVEARSHICVFIEVDLDEKEHKIRDFPVKIADEVNQMFEDQGEDSVKSNISTVIDSIKN